MVYRIYTSKAIYMLVQSGVRRVASGVSTPYRLYTDATFIQFSGRLDGGKTWQPSPAGHLPNSILHMQLGKCTFRFTGSQVALDL